MKYLILGSAEEAVERSAEAWRALRYPQGVTRHLWAWRDHPSDGRRALMIPAEASAAQLDMPQDAYEAILTGAERAALLETLPADWAEDNEA